MISGFRTMMTKLTMAGIVAVFGFNAVTASAEDQLLDTTWTLVEIQSMDDTTMVPPEGKTFSVTLTADGNAAIQADCNRGMGTYETEGSSLVFGPIATTKMLCGPDNFDNQFLSQLGYVRSYVFEGGNLFMATMADGSILEFTAGGDADAEADEGAAPALQETSYDCSHADGSVEETICHNAELAGLDLELAALYKTATQTFPPEDLKMLKAYQRGWIKGRNDCWKANVLVDCVRSEYESRITELQVKTAAFEVPGSVDYKCEDGDALSAYFYFQTKRPSVVVNKGEDQNLVMQTSSKEGATTYEGGNVTFVHMGPEVDYSWLDGSTHCKMN